MRELSDSIVGRNPVKEAIRAGRDFDRICFANGDKTLQQIIDMAKERHIPIDFVDRARLDAIAETKNHQGVVAFVAAHNFAEVEDILARAKQKGEPPFIVILDGLSDPHNLGSILRTANGAGVHGVIIPKRRSVGLNSTVAKTSAGAVEYTPVARVSNVAQTIENLKKEGIWVYGTAFEGASQYNKTDLKGAIALVIGNEGEGIGRLVLEKCDGLIKIPMMGEIQSLNASVATGIILYEILNQRNS
ncbi:MAG: 23S rRNA (guanosine(2251)-2'-O)-methyltransferase RlmB [Eubacteriales bacterium]|nr:23S rRNA (guanosine(2251)-2'-O)-methyltransferase RlmB [Eubacteriales bacterium]